MVTGLDTCTATASDHMAAGTAFLADRDGQNVMYVLGSSATANDLTEELLYLTNRKRTSCLHLLACTRVSWRLVASCGV